MQLVAFIANVHNDVVEQSTAKRKRIELAQSVSFRMFAVVMQCGPLCFCTLFGVVSAISGQQYILSKSPQPIRTKYFNMKV
jgi:hypothetical protein